MPKKTSLYAIHAEKWAGGCGSSNCPQATNVVIAKGKVPCDVLLLGEAPGDSEDVLGRPFVGPAGKLLDYVTGKAFEGSALRLAYTNVVCCLPRDADGNKEHEPDKDAIKACQPRLKETVEVARPRAVVFVGNLAAKWGPPAIPAGVLTTKVTHPAAILRADEVQQDMLIRQAILVLESVREKLEAE